MTKQPSTPIDHDDGHAARSDGSGPDRRRRRRWPRRVVGAAVTLVALYALLGFVGVPLLLRHVAAPRLSKALNGTVELRRATFNPFTFVARLEGARVLDAAGDEVIGLERLEADVQVLTSLLSEGLHVRRGALTGPSATLIIGPDGTINLGELATPSSAAGPRPAGAGASLPRVVVEGLSVRDGRLRFRDESTATPVEKEITSLAFTVDRLDTRPAHRNDHLLEARFESGEQITWKGAVVAEPPAASGEILLRDVQLAAIAPYAASFVDATIAGGTMELEIAYDLAPLGEPRRATARIKRARIDDLLVQHADQPLADIATIELGEIVADVPARSLRVGSVTIEPRSIHVRRGADGVMEIAGLAVAGRSTGTSTSPSPGQPAGGGPANDADTPFVALERAVAELIAGAFEPWSVQVERVEAMGGRLLVEDRAPRHPVSVVVEDLAFSGGPLRDTDAALPFSASGLVGGADAISVEGVARLDGSSVELTLVTDDLDVAWAAAYLPQQLPAPAPPGELRAARLRLDGTASLARRAGGADMTWSGAIGVLALEIADPDTDAVQVSSEVLSLEGEASARVASAVLEAIAFEGATSITALDLDAPFWGELSASAAAVTSTLQVEGARDESGRLQLDVRGQLEATGVAAAAPPRNLLASELARGVVTGIHLDTANGSLEVGDVLLEGPTVLARAALLPPEKQEGAVAPAPAVERPPPALLLQVGHVAVRDGSMTVRDAGGDDTIQVGAEKLSADVVNIVNDGYTPAEVAFESRVGESGRIRLTGMIDPFRAQPYADVTLETESVRLAPYNAFSARYLGYMIESGRAAATIPLLLEQGRYSGTLDARLERFRLGEKVPSPSAPDAPIKLGVSLLRDKDDVIALNVPFSGEAKGYSFRLAPVITSAFTGALTKAATAPFSAIAKVFSGDANVDLSQVSFASASADLGAEAVSKLDVLAAAMRERPAIRLELTGHASRTADEPALREVALQALLLERLRRNRPAAGSLDEASESALIADLHAERFGGATRRVPVPPGARRQQATSVESMRAALLETVEIPRERLLELARARATAAATEIVASAGEVGDRLLVREPVVDDAEPIGHVTFELEAG